MAWALTEADRVAAARALRAAWAAEGGLALDPGADRPRRTPAEPDHGAADRTRRPVPERRRPARDVCGPRAVRGEGEERSAARSRGEGVTLDEVLSGAWEALSRHEAAACPLCGAAMRPRYATGPASVGGRCSGCATTLH